MSGQVSKQDDFHSEFVLQNMSDCFTCFEIMKDSENKPVNIILHEVNPSFEKTMRKNFKLSLGKPLLDLYPEFSDFFSDWMSTVMSREKENSVIKFVKFIPRICKLASFSVIKESSGHYSALFHEIDEYRQEAAVIESMVDGIVYYRQVSDGDGNAVNYKVLNVNPAFVGMLHIERKNVTGKLLTDIMPVNPEHLGIIMNAIEDVIKTEQPKAYEHYSPRLGKWLSITLFTLSEGYGAAVFTDITKFKRMEKDLKESRKKAEEENSAKSELLTNISHELRTPLNVILSAAQLLGLYISDDRLYKKENASRHIKSMRQNCLRLIRMVNNILDSNKIDSGLFQLNMKNRDMVDFIERIIDSTKEYALHMGNRLIFDTCVNEKIMSFDMDAMERVMLNLLSNALKFSGNHGDITVSVREEKDGILLSVKDEGVGIPEDKQEQIFERFKQASNLLVRENEGSGLGLAITKTLVEMHDGTISVKSGEGEGSEFTVILPSRLAVEDTGEDKGGIFGDKLVERINIEFSDIYL